MISRKKTGNIFTLNLNFPLNYESEITFIGLFHSPLPDRPPILGKAIVPYKSGNKCVFDDIPDGKYYIMACSIKRNSHYLDFFDLRNSLRIRLKKPFIFPSDEKNEFTLNFRNSKPTDFPIILNLPELVFKIIQSRQNTTMLQVSESL